MQSHIVNAFFTEDKVRADLLNLRYHVAQHLLFFFDEKLHLFRAVDIDLSVELRLFNLEFRVEQSDPCRRNSFWHLGVSELLVHDYSSHELGLFQASPMFLENLDQVNVSLNAPISLLCDLFDGFDRDLCELFLSNDYSFAVHRGHGYLA